MRTKYISITTILMTFALLLPNFSMPVSAAAVAPNLGTASTFGLLADTMTTVGTSVNGDTGAITQTVVPLITNGSNHLNDDAYTSANIDLGAAIANANSQAPTVTGAAGSDLGGLTLLPGVYNYPGAVNMGSDVTLSGNGVFIFQIAGTLNTTANTKITLADGAQPCNIFWVVNGATTLAANTEFKGNLMSPSAAVTVGINTAINGRILSQNAVTFTNPGPSVITIPNCEQASTTPVPTPSPTPEGTPPVPTPSPTPSPTPEGTPPVPTPSPTPSPTPEGTPPVPSSPCSAVAPANGKLLGESDSLNVWLLPTGNLVINAMLPNNAKGTGTWNFNLGGKIYTVKGNECVSYTVAKPPVGSYNTSVSFTPTGGSAFSFEPVPVTVPTVTGGKLPDTASPWYNFLLIGSVLTVMGAVFWRRKLRE